MSSYRDDTQETAVASDSTWVGITAIAEDSARAVTALLFGLAVLHTSSAAASDEVIDRAVSFTVEQATASDAALDSKRVAMLTTESATAGESWRTVLRVLHEDSATVYDETDGAQRALVIEQAQAADEVIPQRSVATLVVESAKASDTSLQAASELIEDSITASDWAGGALRARMLVLEAATAADEALAGQAASAVTVESAQATDAVVDHLAAADLVADVAVAEDATWSNLPDAGQAWTANADSWAMSRYEPYAFLGVAVIDGAAYGMAQDGVYALDGDAESITGTIRTGKLDIGRGGLVHPLAAYLEYELDGTAEMDVTTTQSGQAQTYTYVLPAEPAAELTNGRFVFGRGLRGRHFSFTLRMAGTHGYINDLSVNTAPTSRRV